MGRRFRFGLQAALDVRTRQEDAARVRLATAERVLQEALEALMALHTRRAETLQQTQSDDPNLRLNAAWYLENLNHQLVGANALVERQANEVEARRQELVAAAMDREALHRLRGRREVEHSRELRKSEERELGEAGIRATAGHLGWTVGLEDRR